MARISFWLCRFRYTSRMHRLTSEKGQRAARIIHNLWYSFYAKMFLVVGRLWTILSPKNINIFYDILIWDARHLIRIFQYCTHPTKLWHDTKSLPVHFRWCLNLPCPSSKEWAHAFASCRLGILWLLPSFYHIEHH